MISQKISGIPSTIFIPGKTYKFTPKAKDIDVDIGKDKLKFSIKNKPKWAQFNQYTGELIGTAKGIISDSEEIVITVTDSLGESDSLSPFPSLLLTCRQGHGDTNGFRYRFTNLCKSPDNHIVDNESVYYFYDDPQSIKFYSCATDSNNSSETNNCSEINNSWLVSDGVLFAKGIKNNATYLYKNY